MARLTASPFAAPALAALALAGCTVGPDYRAKTPAELGVPTAYSVPAPASPEDLTRWWSNFDDPVLGQLVEQARGANTDIAQAIGRLRQAREALVQSRASLLPTLSGSAGYQRNENLRGGGRSFTLPDGTVVDTGGGGTNSFSAGLSASYQVGLFGEIRRTVEASRAQYDASGFDYATVLLSVESEVARNYVLARAYQAQLANARASLAIQDDNLEIAGFRVQAGLVSSVDVEQARSQRAQTAASVPQIEQQYAAAVARLGVLTGQAPGALRSALAAPRAIPKGPASVGVGIPADALRRRPDVRSAERTLAAATARIGVAKAQLYPALAITGNINSNATSLTGLGDAITGGLFAGLTQAIFNGGRLRAQVRSNEAAADTAFANYKGVVLLALEDIENAIVALDSARRRETQFAIAYDAANASAILSRSQYRTGLTDFTTLNQQEAALLSAQNGLTQARSDQATALIALYDALGGGWDPSVVPQAPERGATPIFATEPR
ncbi:RND transporter [Sphingomonas melonis TY]|jgi:multidrug efflux system outer membrane protein|uniref:RND transporter n=2 Tax=Sphingomonas TaxID=13687 RepID=A0A175XZL3_9SPHN|nr:MULTISPECIES: efflux transporter outer membrane subunit [Sphingomonas]AOW24360.1 RND transporter [Sphingomonas melonis TY]ATI55425.1 RND transporter [Sphingomonas melonis]KZB93867.1 RND transporter [Sphingomonas melonis TY]MBI0531377.1 efflux transporter outer membrane subunit [Sphingomonas sp. TX0522]MBX8843887.1 efflux transporter outer membrane subunit [Sphingomonas melonis]